MRKIYPILIFLASLSLPFIATADIGWSDLRDGILTGMWSIFAVVVVVMFIVAGILFLTAQGNPDQLSKAKSAFIWGAVGIVVGIIAYSILTIINDLMIL